MIRVLFIVGPTASGKSRLALEIACMLGGEIVSADSRQIYKCMDIGTAKPGPEERSRAPHHLIDFLLPDALFSAGEFGRMARSKIEEIASRKKTALVVGGSGLYIRAAADGVFESRYRDEGVRTKLKHQAESSGAEALHRRLAEIDPDAAGKIHPNDLKRIVRALEVYELSGEPISQIRKTRTKPGSFEPVFFGLDWKRADLYGRIDERVDEMIRNGLVQEVMKLKDMGYGPECNALDSVGYREVFQYFNGKISFDEMVSLVKQNTRRFAKRQLTWFRADKRIRWIAVSEPGDWKELGVKVVRDFNQPG